MLRLTRRVHAALAAVVRPGCVVVDATAGNGFDTLALARLVGPSGRVFAFDVQSVALNRTAKRLVEHGLPNVSLLLRDHAELREAIPSDLHGRLAAVVFNLGYLPNGNEAIATRAATTVTAIRAAADLLGACGLLSVMTYSGHPDGADEAEAVEREFRRLKGVGWRVEEVASCPGPKPGPKLWLGSRPLEPGTQ